MNIHNEIRQEFLAAIQGKIPGISRFVNGRPVFTNLEEELPAIAVFIDETESEELTVCDEEWHGTINIGIYLEPFMTEAGLDAVAELIRQHLSQAQLNAVSCFNLVKYSYTYDETNAAWIAANLHYEISYQG